jgi:uncharacterized lipoprotein NlpE involved in copper resistance
MMKRVVIISGLLAFAVILFGCDNSVEPVPVEKMFVGTFTTANFMTVTELNTSAASPRVISDNDRDLYGIGGRLTVIAQVRPKDAPWQFTWETDNENVYFDKTKSQIVCIGPASLATLTFTAVGAGLDGQTVSKEVFIRSTVTN